MHSGAMICSTATLTAGIDVKPNDSPQPTTPLSVVTLTTSESAVLRSLSPHAPTSDFPPAVNGMRKAIASICAIFMSMGWMLQIARPRGNPREAAFSPPRRGRIFVRIDAVDVVVAPSTDLTSPDQQRSSARRTPFLGKVRRSGSQLAQAVAVVASRVTARTARSSCNCSRRLQRARREPGALREHRAGGPVVRVLSIPAGLRRHASARLATEYGLI